MREVAAARGLADPAGPAVLTPRQREQEIQRAEERLAARGIHIQSETRNGAGGPLGKGK